VMLGSVLLLVIRVREPAVPEVADEEKKGGAKTSYVGSLVLLLASIFLWFFGYNGVTTFFSNYMREYWHITDGSYTYPMMLAQGVALIAFLPAGWLSLRLGRKRTIMAGVVLLAGSFAWGATFPDYTPLVLVVFGLAGVAWAMINVNSLPMVVQLCDVADVGRFTGYYYTASMAAQILTPVVCGWFIETYGYWVMLYYGALFPALAFVTMAFVKHGDVDRG